MVKQLFSHAEFTEVEDVGFSGGEPTLLANLEELVDAVITGLPNLRQFFFNTNGKVSPKRVINLAERHAKRVKEFHVLVSLDGDRGVYRYTRGVDNHDRCVELLGELGRMRRDIPSLHAGISCTLFTRTASIETLTYVAELAKNLNVDWTFRFGSVSEPFYMNTAHADEILVPVHQQLELMKQAATLNLPLTPFLHWQHQSITEGRNVVMTTAEGRNRCRAGDLFVFVDATGDIYPCHLSSRKIGDYKLGIQHSNLRLGPPFEPCPCLTECTAYPQMIYGDTIGVPTG